MSTTPFNPAWISNLRHRKQLSLRALSRATGFPKSSLHDLETGRHQPDPAEQEMLRAFLAPFSEPSDLVLGVQCYPPRPSHMRRLLNRFTDAAKNASRITIIYPTLCPWLAASRLVREAIGYDTTRIEASLLCPLIDQPTDGANLCVPIPDGELHRLFNREGVYSGLPNSTVKRQITHFLNELIDERQISLPVIPNEMFFDFLPAIRGSRMAILIDDTQLVRVLMNASVEWIESGGSAEAQQLVTTVAEAIDLMVDAAVDDTGQGIIYTAYEANLSPRKSEVTR